MANIIIITGCPGTGKSYLANLLQQHFPALELHSYDVTKERFWDHYGFDSLEDKEKINLCSLQQYYADLAILMLKKTHLLLEYPFHLKHKAVLEPLMQTFHYTPVTIYLHGQMDVIYRRCAKRDNAEHRHPGHLCHRYHQGVPVQDKDRIQPMSFDAFLADCSTKTYDIQLGHSIALDVTDYSTIAYEAVLQEVAANGHWD